MLFLAVIMTAGALAILSHGLDVGSRECATTLASATFVAFRVFDVFEVRDESASALDFQSIANRSLWLALGAVVALQLLATTWAPV